jgi:hypothetical protein
MAIIVPFHFVKDQRRESGSPLRHRRRHDFVFDESTSARISVTACPSGRSMALVVCSVFCDRRYCGRHGAGGEGREPKYLHSFHPKIDDGIAPDGDG